MQAGSNQLFVEKRGVISQGWMKGEKDFLDERQETNKGHFRSLTILRWRGGASDSCPKRESIFLVTNWEEQVNF